MAKVLAVTNQKGGVGKTSTTQALGTFLKKKGYRVLCIDLDPQGNLSFSMNADTEHYATIYNVFKGEIKTLFAVQHLPSCDLISANILLSGVELEYTQRDREFILKTALEPVQSVYDYIIIDTPPALSVLTVNAFTAADEIIIPMLADIFSLQGIAELNETIVRVKTRYNHELKIGGIVLNKYNGRSTLTKEITATARMVAAKLNTRLYDHKIRSSCVVAESQAQQIALIDYAPKSSVAKDYSAFVDEILEGEIA